MAVADGGAAGRGGGDESSSGVWGWKHVRDIQGGQLVYGAGAQQRDFQAMVTLEAENEAVGRDQVVGRREEAEQATP